MKPIIHNLTLIKFTIFSSTFCAITLFASVIFLTTTKLGSVYPSPQNASDPTSTKLDHLVFGIASSGNSWPKTKDYAKLWWKHNKGMKGCVFFDILPSDEHNETTLPPLCLSSDTSKFRYTFKHGLRSSIRVARVVKETVELNHSDVRWYVFGDDDTIFLPENIVKVLSKYDHRLWYYVGTHSEMYESCHVFGYGMAFGGGGFAISAPLAKVLARNFDSCIERYPYLHGSDSRVYSCMAELGVALTHEPGFHQVDLRGNIFGLLAAHPVTPLLSLHHPALTDPIFPNMTTIKALQHLFEAVNVDSQRVLQQTVCYDKRFSWTVSVSWGYAVQVFQNNMLLPDVVKAEKSFMQWRKGNGMLGLFAMDTREVHPDQCRRPLVFFLDNVSYGKYGIISNYKKHFLNCSYDLPAKKLEIIKVVTNKLHLDTKQLQSPRRHCCDVLASSTDNLMDVAIRECKDEELIYMH